MKINNLHKIKRGLKSPKVVQKKQLLLISGCVCLCSDGRREFLESHLKYTEMGENISGKINVKKTKASKSEKGQFSFSK